MRDNVIVKLVFAGEASGIPQPYPEILIPNFYLFFLCFIAGRMLLAFPGTLRPAQSPFPQGWRISVILKISALHPIQATRSGVFRGFLFSGPYPKAVNRHIINILIILHPFHPFSRNPRVSRDTLRGCGKSEYEPMI